MATSTPELVRTMICCAAIGCSLRFWTSLPTRAPPMAPATMATSRPVPATDQAADAYAGQAAEHRADTGVLVAGDLGGRDLLDHPFADLNWWRSGVAQAASTSTSTAALRRLTSWFSMGIFSWSLS